MDTDNCDIMPKPLMTPVIRGLVSSDLVKWLSPAEGELSG